MRSAQTTPITYLIFTLALILPAVVHSQARNRIPLSPGLLAGRALQQSSLSTQFDFLSRTSPLNLTCSPAPCLFPNVQASEGGAPVETQVIAINPNDSSQIMVRADDYNCSSYQGVSSASNGGQTWKTSCLPLMFNYIGELNPVAAYDSNNVAYGGGVEYLDGGERAGAMITLSKSLDNGVTWGKPVTVTGPALGYTLGMPWLAVDTNPGSSFQNRLYMASIQYDQSYNSQVWVSHSSDGGNTWSSTSIDTIQIYPSADADGILAVGSDGAVYLSWLRCPGSPTHGCTNTDARILFSKSSDGGSTWSKPATAAQVTSIPDFRTCGSYFGCLPNTSEPLTNVPAIAVSGAGSTASVYTTFYNWSGTQLQIEVAASHDGGNTWGAPVRVSGSNAGDEFFSWISVDAAGRVLATWLDRRNDPNNVKYQPFLAVSGNGGRSFGRDRALSKILSDPSHDGFHGTYMGDFRTQVSLGTATYVTWMDTRSGNCQSEVGGVQF